MHTPLAERTTPWLRELVGLRLATGLLAASLCTIAPGAARATESIDSTTGAEPHAATPSDVADPATPGAIGSFSIRHWFPAIEAAETPISLAHLNHLPAGSRGWVQARGGHLWLGQDRIRFWGINMAVGAFMPPKEQAEALALRLAKEGFNAVRIGGIDMLSLESGRFVVTYKQQGALNGDHTLNDEAMDRLDYFVHQLRRAGIYVSLPLHMSRRYPQAPDCIEYCEGIDNYLPELIDEQKRFARALLEHVNPYTGRAYKDDPALWAIEINNENSLTHRWANGTIDRYLGDTALAARYGEPLQARWRDWLTRRYATPQALAAAWATRPVPWDSVLVPRRAQLQDLHPRQHKDWFEFMAETENAYMRDMYGFLKSDLGVKALVYGTQASYNQPFARDGMDLDDLHTYFGDLGRQTDLRNLPGNGRPVFEIQNRSALHATDIKDAGAYGIFESKSLLRPAIISEFTYRFGNQYAAEAEPLMSALAGFQDLDGVFLFNYHGMNLYTNRETFPGWYNMTVNAVTRVAAALAFRRGDLTPGTPEVLRKTRESWLEALARSKSMTVSNFHFGGNVRAPYTHNMYVEIVDSATQERVVRGGGAIDGQHVSSSGQIRWKPGAGIAVDTPKSKLAIAFLRDATASLGDVAEVAIGRSMNRYAVVSLIALDDQPLPSDRMLLTIAGHFDQPGEYPREPGQRLHSWGDDAQRIEGVPATVRLRAGSDVAVQVLDETGAPKSRVPVLSGGGVAEFVVGPLYDTGWYLIERRP